MGLSERSVNELKKENEFYVRYKKFNDVAYVINLLLEEGRRFDDRRVVYILGDIFTHKRDENGEFGIIKYKCDTNETTMTPIDNEPYTLSDDEVFALRLLQLQKALIQYKNDIDNNVPRLSGFGEDEE